MRLRIRIRVPGRRGPAAPRPDAVPVRFDNDAVRLEEAAPESAEDESRRRLRRGLVLAAPGALIVAGLALCVFGQGGLLDLRAAHAQEDALQAQVQAQLQKVLEMKAGIARLRDDPRVVERIAREELGYAGKGEVLFLLPDDPDEPARAADLGRDLPRPQVPE